ncbi:transposase, partial [Enterococcus faecium]|uniref:zinc ribbon domain-containing protein n=1 Tax=Enterococcus faecium TaxID=1352 RepID=UPI000D3F066B
SWSSFVIKLQYKTEWYGREIIKKKWFLSSQTCSQFGYKDGKKFLNIRDWTFSICHT